MVPAGVLFLHGTLIVAPPGALERVAGVRPESCAGIYQSAWKAQSAAIGVSDRRTAAGPRSPHQFCRISRGTRVTPAGRGGEAVHGGDLPAERPCRPGSRGGHAVRPGRSRRRRRLTIVINAMSGAVAVGALVVVVELGTPAVSHIGPKAGLPSAGHGGTAVEGFGNANLPTLRPSAKPSVVSTTSPTPPPVVPAPAPTQTAAHDFPVVTQAVTSSAPEGLPVTAAPTNTVTSHVIAATTPSTTLPTTPTATPSVTSESADAQASVVASAQSAGDDPEGLSDQRGPGDQHGEEGDDGQQQGDDDGDRRRRRPLPSRRVRLTRGAGRLPRAGGRLSPPA